MLQRLLQTLVASKNEAADDLLLEALRLGSEHEQPAILETLIQRQTLHGLTGLIAQFQALSESLQQQVLNQMHRLHTALRDCARSDRPGLRIMAMRLIDLGRQGSLAGLLTENLNHPDEHVSRAAVESLAMLARWVHDQTRILRCGSHRGEIPTAAPPAAEIPNDAGHAHRAQLYHQLIEQRPDIELAVSRALERNRTPWGQELVDAAMLLCDWSRSRILDIIRGGRHAALNQLLRRLQHAPPAEQVPAFLLGVTCGHVRSHFGTVFSHITGRAVLSELLALTHHLADLQLQVCMKQALRGAWLAEESLLEDLQHRAPAEAATIARWIACSGLADLQQDALMQHIRLQCADIPQQRLRILRILMSRPRGASVQLLRQFLADPDESLARMAVREIVRRKPPDWENMLLPLMTSAPASIRRIIGRSVGQNGFESFWHRFDRLNQPTRQQAGRAMLKLLPDAPQRLARRLTTGTVEQRLKAMLIVSELDLVETVRNDLRPLCSHPHPKVRSRAIGILSGAPTGADEATLQQALNDNDARVRANAIEAVERSNRSDYVTLLASRLRSSNARERANAIKALHRMKVSTATRALQAMLRDDRPDHRVSGLWALRQIGWWRLVEEVGRLAREDGNLRVRRYALAVLRSVARELEEENKRKAG
jgi:HEAT repeat protein